MSVCPHCGRTQEDVAVDLDANVLLLRGKPIRVEPRMAEIVTALLAAKGGYLTRQQIAPAIWGKNEHSWPPDWAETIRGAVFELRRRMEPHGVTIEWQRGPRRVHIGYRIVKP